MIININHFSFTVSDVEKSIIFYQHYLGLELIDKSTRDKQFSEQVTGIPDAHLKIAYLRAVNCQLELVQYLSPIGMKLDTRTCNVGSAHVCFVVDNYQQMVDIFKKNNINICGCSTIIPSGPNKGRGVLYFEDPDGNKLEIISQDVLT